MSFTVGYVLVVSTVGTVLIQRADDVTTSRFAYLARLTPPPATEEGADSPFSQRFGRRAPTARMDDLSALASEIRDAERVVALTGAGVSTASGIPDFRGDSGVWTRLDPSDFHRRRFDRDPTGFWEDRLLLHETMYAADDIAPNAAHEALAALAAADRLDAIVTQNTDGLHAGADAEVIELHGNAHRVVCTDCGERVAAAPVRERVRDGELPPRCAGCGGLLKPDVVLFGEQLPPAALARAEQLAADADAFLAIGSSLTVEPAASLPRDAARRGATLAVINLESTPHSSRADYDVRADVTDVLPDLVKSIESEE